MDYPPGDHTLQDTLAALATYGCPDKDIRDLLSYLDDWNTVTALTAELGEEELREAAVANEDGAL